MSNLKRIKIVISSVMLAFFASGAQASHIDELGMDISVLSSNGLGDFSLLYREFFGSDGATWTGASWGNPHTQSGGISMTINMTQGAGVLSPSGTVSLDLSSAFDGIVDQFGVQTAGFGVGQINTQFVNGLTDAAQFSQIVNFSIAGFDPTQTYLITAEANDCCFVAGGNPVFNQTIQFDPRSVVGVSEPSALFIMGIGLLSLVGVRKIKKSA